MLFQKCADAMHNKAYDAYPSPTAGDAWYLTQYGGLHKADPGGFARYQQLVEVVVRLRIDSGWVRGLLLDETQIYD